MRSAANTIWAKAFEMGSELPEFDYPYFAEPEDLSERAKSLDARIAELQASQRVETNACK